MKPIRVVFGFEAGLTTLSGIQALVLPASSAAQFVADPQSGPTLDLVRWLGAAWVVIGGIQIGLLRRGSREAWSIALPPILLGDALHLAGQGMLLANGGRWGFEAAASVLFSVVFATCRVLALQRLDRVA